MSVCGCWLCFYFVQVQRLLQMTTLRRWKFIICQIFYHKNNRMSTVTGKKLRNAFYFNVSGWNEMCNIIQIMNVYEIDECNGKNIFIRWKMKMFHSTQLRFNNGTFSSFTEWKYSHHCTNKNKTFIICFIQRPSKFNKFRTTLRGYRALERYE